MSLRVFPAMASALLFLSGCGGGNSGGTTTPPQVTHNQWTWVSGSNLANQQPIYGSLGTAAPSNVPGARWSSAGWIDASGSIWVFGGDGVTPGAVQDYTRNDLWKYSAGEWAWMAGADIPDQPSVYGIEGVASSSNIPGARYPGGNWIDSSGDMWLFGGSGVTSFQVPSLNDLWKYSAGQWTWVGGTDLYDQPGIYGTLGVSSATNLPGARFKDVSWTDPSGKFWLFGGDGPNTLVGNNFLNDLWKYSGGQWTWVSGSDSPGQPGTYGTQGTPASTNVPGAREDAAGCSDASGSLWLLGGNGFDSQGTLNFLNDLWKYNAGQWTWMSGPTISNPVTQLPTYGTQGTPSAANVPGGRYGSVCWADTSGNVWLFGGDGYDSAGNFGDLNDLWKFSAGQWTWVSGANLAAQPGIYGTQGTASPNNTPGGRVYPVALTDSSGYFWLFAGGGIDSAGTQGLLNDLWKYHP